MSTPTSGAGIAGAARGAALAALSGLPQIGQAEETTVAPTGRRVFAGGDVERLLLSPAFLAYRAADGVMAHPVAQVGDVITLTEAAAARYDSLGTTGPAPVEAEPEPEPEPEPAKAAKAKAAAAAAAAAQAAQA